MIGRQIKKDGVVYTINGIQKVENFVEVTVYENMEPMYDFIIPDYTAKQVIKFIQDYINKTDDVTIAGIKHGIKHVFEDIKALCFGKGGVS
jgi:hypothetical protein